MRTAFLTGATGFIGSRLGGRLLDEGWAVHALIRPQSDTDRLPAGLECHVHDGSVEALTAALKAAAPDIVIHLASLYLTEHRPDQVDALVSSNILLPAQLAEAMSAAGATRLVNTGTAWQHYEGEAYNPVNLYAATKQAAEDLLRYYHEARGLSVVTLQLFDTYGPGDTRRKLVQLLIDAATTGEPLGMSPGEQVIDLTHVDDVVEAFMVASESLLGSERALWERAAISGERYSVRELVSVISNSLGRQIIAAFGERPYRAREVMRPKAAGSRTLSGWRPKRSLRSTLSEIASTTTPYREHAS